MTGRYKTTRTPHGTVTRYINQGCRCDPCRTAKAVYEGNRLRGKRVHQFISAAPARKHVRFLLTNGWGSKTLGERVGVSRHTILNLAAGKTRTIKVVNSNKILGTSIMDAPGPRGGGMTAQWKQDHP